MAAHVHAIGPDDGSANPTVTKVSVCARARPCARARQTNGRVAGRPGGGRGAGHTQTHAEHTRTTDTQPDKDTHGHTPSISELKQRVPYHCDVMAWADL